MCFQNGSINQHLLVKVKLGGYSASAILSHLYLFKTAITIVNEIVN